MYVPPQYLQIGFGVLIGFAIWPALILVAAVVRITGNMLDGDD